VNAPTNPKPRTESQRLASVLKEEAAALNDAIDQVIGSRSETEFGLADFSKALQTIRSVRLELEAEAEKLAASETAVAS
jgi:hypothetical protein